MQTVAVVGPGLMGLGFPPATGGVLHWAEDFGSLCVLDTCDALARAHDARFTPSPWLRERVVLGRGLADWRHTSTETTISL
jgi:hypothetical protein